MGKGLLAFTTVLLLGAAVGFAFVAVDAVSLSLYYAAPKLLLGCLAREFAWLSVPLTGTLLGLLSVRSQTFVAPITGAVGGAVAGYLIIHTLRPDLAVIPSSAALPALPLTFGVTLTFVLLTAALAYASVWLDTRPGLAWLGYTIAAAYALCLSLLMTYSRRVLPPGGELHLIVVPFILGVILSGLVAGTLVGRTFAVWAGTSLGQAGQLIAAEMMAKEQSNLFPLVLLVVVLSASLAIPGAYFGEVIRRRVLGSRVSATPS